MQIVYSRTSKILSVFILLMGLALYEMPFAKELTQGQINQSRVKELTEKGLVFFRQHQYLESVKSFSEAIQLSKEPYDLLLYRANVYLQLGENQKALLDATQAIQVKPRNSLGYQLRASVFSRNNQIHKGVNDLTLAISLDPTLSDIYVRRGDAYLILGEPQKALEDLSRAIHLGNRTHLVFRYRGYALSKLGRHAQAIDSYSMALSVNPMDSPSLIARGWIYSCRGKLRKAIADFGEVLNTNPNDVDARLQRGITYSDIGDLRSAKVDLNFGVSRGVNHPEYYLHLADVYYRLEKIDKALDINKKLELLNNKNSVSPMYLQRGLFYFHQGKVVDSKKYYKKGIDLAEKHLDMEEINEAIQELKALGARHLRKLNTGKEILDELKAAQARIALLWKPDISSCSAIGAHKEISKS